MKNKKDLLLVNLELEKSKINREKSVLVLDKALLLYFTFLFTAVVGFVAGYIRADTMNILIIMSFGVLLIGTVSYWYTMRREEEKLDTMIFNARKTKVRGGRNAN